MKHNIIAGILIILAVASFAIYNIVTQKEPVEYFKVVGMKSEENGIIDYTCLEQEILDIADARLFHNIKVEYTIESFPAKSYKGKFIPSGNYPTILVTIGEGNGNNFWTLLYPDFFNISFDDNNEVEYRSYIYDKIVG